MNKKSLQIGMWLVAMALAAGVAAHFWSLAFPVAAVAFPLSRVEVKGRLGDFVSGTGAVLEGYRSAILFQESTETKNFIERQYGPGRLAEAAGKGVEVWSWRARWFRPGQHEEYQASADPAGNVVGFEHVIEEERALPELSEAQARLVAEGFLRRNIARHPLAGLRYLETSSEKKPHRTDYTFTWEQDSLRMGDAPYHLSVTVQGNEIGSYGEYLKVPDWWTVQYQRQRAVNDLCYRVAIFGAFAVIVGLAVAFFLGVSRHQVRWRDAAPWGWLVVIAVVGAATQINHIPEVVFGYPTTEQWGPWVAGEIFAGGRTVLGEVLIFWAIVLVADCIYRAGMPGKSSFRRALGPLALHDGETVRAMGVGIAFAVFSLAYVCVFYATGQRLGVWCPVEIDFSRTLSGPMPWVEGIQTGLSASFTEEMIFRVGALLLIWRVVRVRWVAVVLSAAIWGFLHSNYPQMPGYTRGIELTIAGIVWGTLMLRYGIVATLTIHYLYDCWMVGMVSLQSAGWGNKAGALAACLWPVAFFLWGVLRKRRELEPEAPHAPLRPDVARPPPREWKYAPLAVGRRGVALILLVGVAGLAAVFLLPKPQDKMEALGKLDLSRSAILDKADEALRAHSYSPAGYERVTSVNAKGVPAEYLIEHGNLDGIAGLYNKEWPELTWTVRYFRFLEPEEFEVKLDEHGGVLTWNHTVLREAAGAALEGSEALARAKKALAAEGIDLSRQELVRQGPIQQEHRRDWLFGFDQKDFGWGDAKLRTYIWVQGNEALNLTRIVKVPDAWIIEHSRKGWRQLVSGEFRHWIGMAENVIVGVLLILAVQKHLTPWRRAFLYALFPLGIKVVNQVNQAQQFYAGYSTTAPRAHYLISQWGGMVQSLALTYVAGVFSIAVALGFLHWAWGWTPGQLVVWPADRRERGRFWRDTLLVVFGGIVLFWLAGLVNAEALGHVWPAEVASVRYWSVEEWAPWVGAVTEGLQSAYNQLIRLAISASVPRLIWGRYPRLAWGLLFLLPLLNLGTPETLGGFLWGLGIAEATVALTAWLALKVWRFNVTAVFLTYLISSILESVMLFLRKGGPVYQWQAAPLVGLMVAALAVGWWRGRGGGRGRGRVQVKVKE